MTQLIFRLFNIFSLLLLATTAMGIDLSQSLDKTSMAFEEQATLTITVEWPGGQTAYLFDRPLQPTLEKLRVQRFATSVASQVTATGEVTRKTFTFTLVPTGSGTARVEPMTIHYLAWPDSIPGDLTTSSMMLTVAAAIPNSTSTGLFGVLPIWGWILIWVVVLAVAGFGVLLFLRGRKSPVPVKQVPSAEFLEKLTHLAGESAGDLKRFQTGLYKLLVKFAQDQLKVDCTGRSAEEIASAIRETKLSESDKEKLTGWLLRADREKFSPLPPAPGETIRLEAEVRQYFEQMQMKK
ncbi:MAG: hypothetical protein IPH75_06340 [bacterium]|nr:hypothetical protein [bacterium]